MKDLRAKDLETIAKERKRRREIYTLKKKRKAVRMAKLDAKIAALQLTSENKSVS